MPRRWVIIGALVVAAAIVTALVLVISQDADPAASTDEQSSSTGTVGSTPSETGSTPTSAPAETAEGDQDSSESTAAGGDEAASGGEAALDGVAPTLAPVPLDEPASFGNGMAARVLEVTPVVGEGVGRGETGGPSLQFTIELTNGTGQDVVLDRVVVNAYYGPDADPAVALFGDPRSRPFDEAVPPGGRSTGDYVFAVPEDGREQITVTVSYIAPEPVVAFSGSVGG